MTLNEYLNHYFVLKDALIFLGLSILIITIVCAVLLIYTKVTTKNKKNAKVLYYEHSHNFLERYFEMMFSASSILSFLSVYYLIDRFGSAAFLSSFWNKYSDFMLLLMIILSCIINSLLDKFVVPLKHLTHTQKASLRLMGMFYVLCVFCYIKFIYENNNYDRFIIYFLGLVIGRFVYFDASFKDFLKTFGEALRNILILVLCLTTTGLMCLYGFSTKYLLKSNGVLVSTFIANIFLLIAIFIIHNSHILCLFIPNPNKRKRVKGAKKVPVKEIDVEESDYEADDED